LRKVSTLIRKKTNEEESNEGREFLPLMLNKVMREGVPALDEEESNEGRTLRP